MSLLFGGGRIYGVVLAAGASRRMGRAKALVEWRGRPFVAWVVEALRDGGVLDVVVVTRAELAAAVAAALPPDVRVVPNEAPERGMLSSLLVGLEATRDPEAVLVALVDHPAVRPTSIRRLLEAHAAHPDRIVLPTWDGRRGHPALFPAACLPELRAAPPDEGARHVVRRDPTRILEIEVDDPGIRTDVNAPRDLAILEDPRRPDINH